MKFKLLFTISLFLSLTTFSQTSFEIEPGMLHTDEAKSFILCNQDLDVLNNSISSLPEMLLSLKYENKTYSFAQPVNSLSYGVAYAMKETNSSKDFQLYFSPLPVIHIDTEHQIVDEPGVLSTFSLVEKDGSRVESFVGVEYRGSYTQTLEKKSFRVEFWIDDVRTDTKDVRLLDLRSDDDWNLQAMYNEPLRFNNVIGFELWRHLGSLYYEELEPDAKHWVDMRYVELFVNGDYRGLYGLGERLDRKQLKLKKFKDGEKRGELYKAFSWTPETVLEAVSPFDNNQKESNGWEQKYPKLDEELDWSNFYDLLYFLTKSTDEEFYAKYDTHFSLSSAVNYFIFINLIWAADNNGKNAFIGRYKEHEPYFYTAWDLDGIFGVIWDGSNQNVTDVILSNGMYERLLKEGNSTGFRAKLKARWNEVRDGAATHQSITGWMENTHDFLQNIAAYERESIAWPAYTYPEGQLEYQKDWLAERLDFLDNYFDRLAVNVVGVNAGGLRAYPTIATQLLTIESDKSADYVLMNAVGVVLVRGKIEIGLNHLNVEALPAGTCFVRMDSGENFKFIKR